MRNVLRVTLTGAALAVLAAGCSRDTTPTADLGDLGIFAPDASIGSASGQASLPGLETTADVTYQGSVDAAATCAFSASSGRVECAPVTRDGLTITRSYAFTDAAGAVQTHRDSLTRTVNTKVAVSGTTTTSRGTLTVNRASTLTVTGLGRTSTSHQIDGAEQGTTSGSVSTSAGSATVTETFAVTTVGVVVPAPFSATTWPTAGTSTRSSTLTVARDGTTRSSVASEVATYNGTSVIPVTVTRDGRTRSCTRNLATHTMSCP